MKTSKLKIVDTTLRDGEQTAGVSFFPSEKIEIAKELDRVGVEVIEAGIPASNHYEIEVLQEMNKLNLNSQLITWNRMVKNDVDKALLTGIKDIHISMPVSDIHIEKKLKKSREWVEKQAKETIEYAMSHNLRVSVGTEDSSRADIKYLLKIYNMLEKLGVSRIRYADTLSILSPITTKEVIEVIKNEISTPIDFHGHNDFGMATANSYSAYKAGAEYISTCVNGIGERAGNTALEEIIAAVNYFEGEKEYNTKALVGISKLVEKTSAIRVGQTKPIVGEKVFSHESGIHVDGYLKDKSIYEYLSPLEFDRKTSIILGKHSGRSAIKYKLKKRGLNPSIRELEEIKSRLEYIYYNQKKVLSMDEVLKEVGKVCNF